MINNTKEGVIYGAAAVGLDHSAKEFCNATGNKDSRCANVDNYELVVVNTRYGYADALVGVNALVPKNFPNLDKLRHSLSIVNKNTPFVKAKIVAGNFGEILEILPNESCHWSGMPRLGGTVCPAYDYDYRKDFTGVVFR